MADETRATTAPAGRKIPAPQGNPETQPFWAAAKDGRLMIGRCAACGKAHYYPRSICPFCFTPGATMEAASGRATIYTVSVTVRGTPEPYAIGYAELAEGPRILTNFLADDLLGLKIGEAVELTWTPTEPDAPPAPMFRKA